MYRSHKHNQKRGKCSHTHIHSTQQTSFSIYRLHHFIMTFGRRCRCYCCFCCCRFWWIPVVETCNNFSSTLARLLWRAVNEKEKWFQINVDQCRSVCFQSGIMHNAPSRKRMIFAIFSIFAPLSLSFSLFFLFQLGFPLLTDFDCSLCYCWIKSMRKY